MCRFHTSVSSSGNGRNVTRDAPSALSRQVDRAGGGWYNANQGPPGLLSPSGLLLGQEIERPDGVVVKAVRWEQTDRIVCSAADMEKVGAQWELLTVPLFFRFWHKFDDERLLA
jgi:hypothetical protein